ncbi:MAG TPA: nucleotide sugar dehydrogenase [Candidatus Acidoferrales bacterium]|nr:nucleotide sugar dehydrogenase [Candidatus Acidoferrales bacterium]
MSTTVNSPAGEAKRQGEATSKTRLFDVVVIGGFGRVGLPLAITFAAKGKRVCALDIDTERLATIGAGKMPFKERGCQELLVAALEKGNLQLSVDPRVVSEADVVIFVVGTPVDRHLNPELGPLQAVLEAYLDYMVDGQLIILRSTVYPGTTDQLKRWIGACGVDVELAFCPERIAEGHAAEELCTLPQIISSYSDDGLRRCTDLFTALGSEVVVLSPIEAELAKLFSNVWRYTLFATANHFFMIANDHDADFHRIHHAMTYKYPRVQDMPKPGFAAGPCLFKDAMQLVAFDNNHFSLGHAAMLVNEGLPNYLVARLKMQYDLCAMTVGILGMTFKGDSDDKRDSLSYKLRKIFAFESAAVLCSDPYLDEAGFVGPDELISRSDVIVLATPHREYRSLRVPADKIVVDIWNVWGNGCKI